MAVLRFRNTAILAKLEATPGTDSVPTGTTDALLANDVSIDFQPVIIESAEFAGGLDVGAPIVGGTPVQTTIQCFAKGSGTAGTAPEYGPLLRACGLSETIVATTSVTYAPISAAIPSVTMYIFHDGIRWSLVGNRGTLTLTMTSQALWTFDFTFSGRFAAHTDLAIPSITLDTVRPVPWKASVFSIGGTAAGVQQVTLATNNTLVAPENPNDPEGFDVHEVTVRDIQGTMNPYKQLVATRNTVADFRSGTTRALVAALTGAAGNIMTLTIPSAKYRNSSEANQNGLLVENVPFSATGVNNGFSLVYT